MSNLQSTGNVFSKSTSPKIEAECSLFTHQQLTEAINELPVEVLPELATFIDYLRFKVASPIPSPEVKRSESSGSAFLLSIADLGVADEDDISERVSGPMSPERIIALQPFLKNCTADIIFVTTFIDRATLFGRSGSNARLRELVRAARGEGRRYFTQVPSTSTGSNL